MARLIYTYVALLLLLGCAVALSFVPLGGWNLWLSLAIAAAKTLLIMAFFMQLARADTLIRLAAAIGFAWLLLLFLLGLADYLGK